MSGRKREKQEVIETKRIYLVAREIKYHDTGTNDFVQLLIQDNVIKRSFQQSLIVKTLATSTSGGSLVSSYFTEFCRKVGSYPRVT